MHKLFRVLFITVFFSVSLLALTQRKVLSPEEAFDIQAEQINDSIVVSINLGKDIYLYADKLHFNLIAPTQATLDAKMNLPKAKAYQEYQIYDQALELIIPYSLLKEYVDSGDFTLQVAYQGCSHAGICYQPLTKDFVFKLPPSSQGSAVTLSEQDQIAQSFSTHSIWLVLLSFFGFGVLLSLTPCVFPMIPILSSIIVAKSNEKMSTKRAFILSLVYVLAMAAAYTIAGILAGLFGANIQAMLQNPWAIGVFSAIFVALAFSMFGFFQLQIPSFIQSRLSKKTEQIQGGGLGGVAVMGFLSALIVGPCVAAPLAGALVYIGQSGDALLGGAALFVMSIGMGLPLILIGIGAGKYMPKPGGWMDSVSAVFGVVMLALAVWMLSRVVNAEIVMLLWMALAIGSAVYLGALEQLGAHASGWRKLLKSFAVILFVYGITLFIGAMTRASDPLDPLSKIGSVASGNATTQSEQKLFSRVGTLAELNTILKQSKKPVMLDFYADWCVSCIELEKFTFSDPSVRARMQYFTLLQVDVTQNSADDKALLKEFGLFGPPAIMFFKDAKELANKRLIGFKDATEFLAHLNTIGK